MIPALTGPTSRRQHNFHRILALNPSNRRWPLWKTNLMEGPRQLPSHLQPLDLQKQPSKSQRIYCVFKASAWESKQAQFEALDSSINPQPSANPKNVQRRGPPRPGLRVATAAAPTASAACGVGSASDFYALLPFLKLHSLQCFVFPFMRLVSWVLGRGASFTRKRSDEACLLGILLSWRRCW